MRIQCERKQCELIRLQCALLSYSVNTPYSYPEWSQENLDEGKSLVNEENVSIRTAG